MGYLLWFHCEWGIYCGSRLSTEASMYATYQYAIKNKLSYEATSELIKLIRIHCPAQNSCPTSLYKLKKQFSNSSVACIEQYCSNCLDKVPSTKKQCPKRECKYHELCYYCVLPFEEHVKEIFSGQCLCRT